jgi:hypothetical protein
MDLRALTMHPVSGYACFFHTGLSTHVEEAVFLKPSPLPCVCAQASQDAAHVAQMGGQGQLALGL